MAASKPYRVHPLAWEDIDVADQWYFERSPEASDALIAEISEAIESICKYPQRWPKYRHGTHRLLLRRFPFSIVYLEDADFVDVIAVAHHKRKPGYWKKRV